MPFRSVLNTVIALLVEIRPLAVLKMICLTCWRVKPSAPLGVVKSCPLPVSINHRPSASSAVSLCSESDSEPESAASSTSVRCCQSALRRATVDRQVGPATTMLFATATLRSSSIHSNWVSNRGLSSSGSSTESPSESSSWSSGSWSFSWSSGSLKNT